MKKLAIITMVAGALLVVVGEPGYSGSDPTAIVMGAIVALAGVGLYAFEEYKKPNQKP